MLGWWLLFHASALFEAVPGASLWFLPSGWTVAFVLVFGRRAWPLTVLGPLAVGWEAYTSLEVAVVDILQDLRHAAAYGGAAVVLREVFELRLPITNLRQQRQFFIAMMSASLVSAMAAAVLIGGDEKIWILLAFWIGDALGAIALAPGLAIGLEQLRAHKIGAAVVGGAVVGGAVVGGAVVGDASAAQKPTASPLRRGLEWIVALGHHITGRTALRITALVATVWLAFGMPVALGLDVQIWYLIFLPLAWIAMRDGSGGLTVGLLLASGLAVSTIRQYGMQQSLFELQALILTAAVTGQLLAAATADRERAVEALRRHRLLLEEQVAERTDELARANHALQAENRERRQAEQEARRAMQAKGDLLANVSHEIRTPMNGILGLTRLLLRGELATNQRGRLELLQDAARHLLELLNDLLDLSKIEAGKLHLESFPFRPRDEIEALFGLLRPTALEKGITLRSQIEPEVPETLVGDGGRLRQVLLNLLDNALKFTGHGTVELRVRPVERPGPAEERPGASSWMRFAVQDTGIGISPDAQTTLFEPFSQADTSTSRRYGGTGLGLANCRRIVELMGGDLGLESQPGLGSTFWLEIPFDLDGLVDMPSGELDTEPTVPSTHDGQALPAAQPSLPEERARFKILVVDDDAINRLVAVEELIDMGYRADAVCDGREALTALAENRWDLVLMDCQMPELDGYETTRHIRRDEEKAGARRVPILALTAHAQPEESERCMAVGMDGFLTKPFTQESLAALVDGWLLEPHPPE